MGQYQTDSDLSVIKWSAWKWLTGRSVGERRGLERFARQSRRDQFGLKIHLALACAWCFFVAWPTTFVEFAGFPLAAWTFVRVIYTFGLAWSLFLQPLAMLWCAFWIWNAAGLLWTPDLHQGVVQASLARWIWPLFMLWPVIEKRGWLIASLVAGFAAGNAAQLAHAIGTHFDLAWLRFDRQPDRNSGWWQPVVGG